MYMDMRKTWKNITLSLYDCRIIRSKFIWVFLWLVVGAECKTGDAVRSFTLQTGGSLTIPCHYDTQYIQHKKYWCYDAGAAYNYCSILASANETKGRVSVIDHPDQSLFTVTMTNLQDQDTGTYWCAVEIKGILNMDVTEQLYLAVQSAPDVSVVSSSVSGDEGGNISVKCLYSSAYKNKHKQWCRYKDKSCYTSQSSSVQISDDERESFTVLMSGLMLSDSGWYFCSVGDRQAPVQLTVTGKTATTVTSSTGVFIHAASFPRNSSQTPGGDKQQNILHLKMWLPLLVLMLLMMILVTMATVIQRQKLKTNNINITHETPDKACAKPDDSVNPECDVTYSSVIKLHQTKACSPVCEEENVIYSSVCEQN
ncbi:CMRF35-like molecule 8 isoform X2 [Triplophysa dalaica]|uniref:CMRF35-like molecule 8 isoform X2 n=1 Tax=Triplophysa dalaica TaxID=1582913 RepID=UPI0024DFFF57|nr:CMRF35-like molecule 8 isoform X2 [Triplophysa dalaica]